MTATALKLIANDPDADIQVGAAVARHHIEELEQVARAADKAAAEAQDAFKRTPTAETATSREVAKQVALNAHEAVTAFADSVAQLLKDADREAKRAELAKLSTQLSGTEFDRHRDRINEIVASTRRDMRGALTELMEAIGRSNDLRARARNLAEGLGMAPDYPPVTIEYLLERHIPRAPIGHTEAMSLSCFSPNGTESERRWRLQFNELLRGGGQ